MTNTPNRQQRRAAERHQRSAAAQLRQIQITPSPLPVATECETVDTPEGKRVVLRAQTPQGLTALFLSPDHTRALIADLERNALQAETGIEIATPGVLLPHPPDPEDRP